MMIDLLIFAVFIGIISVSLVIVGIRDINASEDEKDEQ